jgi:hypothetical protein
MSDNIVTISHESAALALEELVDTYQYVDGDETPDRKRRLGATIDELEAALSDG